jgi:hypothetical protein
VLKISKVKVFTKEEVKEIGDKLGVDWNKISLDEAIAGMEIELEHGTMYPKTNITDDDPIMTMKIVLSHMNECPKNNYYSQLKKLEERCK